MFHAKGHFYGCSVHDIATAVIVYVPLSSLKYVVDVTPPVLPVQIDLQKC